MIRNRRFILVGAVLTTASFYNVFAAAGECVVQQNPDGTVPMNFNGLKLNVVVVPGAPHGVIMPITLIKTIAPAGKSLPKNERLRKTRLPKPAKTEHHVFSVGELQVSAVPRAAFRSGQIDLGGCAYPATEFWLYVNKGSTAKNTTVFISESLVSNEHAQISPTGRKSPAEAGL